MRRLGTTYPTIKTVIFAAIGFIGLSLMAGSIIALDLGAINPQITYAKVLISSISFFFGGTLSLLGAIYLNCLRSSSKGSENPN